MACFFPYAAYRHLQGGGVSFREPAEIAEKLERYEALQVPCGSCLGCRADRARSWSVRCHLELSQHSFSSFLTLTYDEDSVPEFRSLRKSDLSAFIKRVRSRVAKDARVRFFGCGEYGEQTKRPHYHAIIFGLPPEFEFSKSWPFGTVRSDPVLGGAIDYVAGYVSKKIGWKQEYSLVSDSETGEVLMDREAPFILMSRRPGIGAAAREYFRSWRSFAVHKGVRVAVPRYLHDAWKAVVSDDEVELLLQERRKAAFESGITRAGREQLAKVAATKLANRSARRTAL